MPQDTALQQVNYWPAAGAALLCLIGLAIVVCLMVLLAKSVSLSTLLGVMQKQISGLENDVGKLFERLDGRACQVHSARIEEHGRRLNEHDARIKTLEHPHAPARPDLQ